MTGDSKGIKTVNHSLILGPWVARERVARRLTQAQLVERMDDEHIDTNWLSQLESGARKRMIGQPYVGLLARALGVTEVDVLRGAGMITESGAGAPAR